MIFLWFLVVFVSEMRTILFLLLFVSFCCMHLYFMFTAVSYQMSFHWCSFMYPHWGFWNKLLDLFRCSACYFVGMYGTAGGMKWNVYRFYFWLPVDRFNLVGACLWLYNQSLDGETDFHLCFDDLRFALIRDSLIRPDITALVDGVKNQLTYAWTFEAGC